MALFVLATAGALVLGVINADAHAPSHPPVSWPVAILQMAVAVAICWMWFVGFRASREVRSMAGGQHDVLQERVTRWWTQTPARALVLMSLPAVVFALAMRDQYNPAVFVMALVAIFVAAEHYSGISEAKKELDDTRLLLQATKDELLENKKSIDMLLNDDSLAKWKDHVYKDYLGASDRIDAVIRIFDIDEAWWERDGDWEQYKTMADVERPTLFLALTHTKAGAGRSDCVQFVADMPVYGALSGAEATSQPEAFEKLFGLTWWLVVLEHVRCAREQARDKAEAQKQPQPKTPAQGPRPFVALRIASSPSWMHAIDNKVYQVIERPAPYPATVRSLSDHLRTASESQRLRQWAHDDVRQTARRGWDGEEYVCAVLRLVGLARAGAAETNPLKADYLKLILHELGMSRWLDSKFLSEAKRARVEKLCVQVFLDFALQRVALSDESKTVGGLFGELI